MPPSRARDRPRATTRTERARSQRTLGRAGLLAALSPLVVPALLRLHARSSGELITLGDLLGPMAWLVAASLGAGALALAQRPREGRVGIIAGGLGFGLLGTLALAEYPGEAMMLLIAIVVTCAWVYAAPEAEARGHTQLNSRLARARMASLGTMAAVLLATGFRMTDAPDTLAYLLASLALSVALTIRALARPGRRDLLLGAGVLASLGGVVLGWDQPEHAALALVLGPALTWFELGRRVEHDPLHQTGFDALLLGQPARLLVGTFLLAGFVGMVALSLPASSTAEPIELIDAAFTSFSAVCVTGLAVLDTGVDFSLTGQILILILIQVGGLGIMSFSTAAMVLLGQRLSMKQEQAMIELLGRDRRAGVVAALRRMLVISAIVELGGALILSATFIALGEGWGSAIWRGLFTAISAYCNAGFALQGDSLVGYQQNPVVLHCIGVLIIIGGLGPAVVAAIPAFAQGGRLDLHARIVLLMSLALLIVPAVLIAALEWNHSLAGLALGDRLHNAWFQSLTTRTAGFNSVDFAAMTPATQTLVEMLMFVGGSPGSTSGGVKTTTVFVLGLSIATVARGGRTVAWGGWAISAQTVSRAAAVASLGAISAAFALFAVQLTQAMTTRVALFEVVSALGTVGLSIGGTAALDEVGKLIIIACMFLGRVAPLTMFLIFTGRGHHGDALWEYPEQDVSVG